MFCPKCGSQQPDGSKFCGVCGAPISAPSQPVGPGPQPSGVGPQPWTPTPQTGVGVRPVQGLNVFALAAAIVAVLVIFFLNMAWISVPGFGGIGDMSVGDINGYIQGLSGLASSLGGSSLSGDAGMAVFFVGFMNILIIVATVLCIASAVVRIAALIPSPEVQQLVVKVPGILHKITGIVVVVAPVLWVVGLMVSGGGFDTFKFIGIGVWLTLIAGVALLVLDSRSN